MPLSSEDVVNWDLKTGMRGYLVPQVDELLDEVADELDRLNRRITELEAEREAVRNSLDDQFEVEETLRRTLFQAQRAADQTIAEADAEAVRIVEEATAKAGAIVGKAKDESGELYAKATREATKERASVRAQLEAEEARLRARRSELRKDLERLGGLEAETRRLLRGLYEDRLRELQGPPTQLPAVDADESSSTESSSDDEPSVDTGAGGTEAVADGTDAEDGIESVPETDGVTGLPESDDPPPQAVAESPNPPVEPENKAASVGVRAPDGSPTPLAVVVTHAPTVIGVGAGADAVADDASVPSTRQEATTESADEGDTRPEYLEAVDVAVQTIAANDVADAPTSGPEGGTPPGSNDLVADLVDGDEPGPADAPAGEPNDVMPPPRENLFDDAPRRRRRGQP